MKTIVLGILIGLAGCGAEEQPSCVIPPTSNTVYGDCHSRLADGTEAVTECGQLPGDGTPGTSLPVGCTMQIGTSTPEIGTCLSVCP